ncbi:uncharacterized protein LOC119410294 [Nematolebias whitei]|uniref:uncharacterized protein LOC119410294 n=1 Tax=Nematolebias whitei TaxID=451745 RepID=UPI0018990708|nr:uncharacterized protein LOC119410294 [Nematolebias whitei]
MRKTFSCDESIIITIPIRSLKNIREGQLMPENFHCVFRDNFKVFVVRGKPKPLGAAQAIAGVFLLVLGLVCANPTIISIPNVVFVISGMLSFTAGGPPNIHVTKLSFSLNIICFFWSLVAFSICVTHLFVFQFMIGIKGLILSLEVVESVLALFLIYWSSKAVCRDHFNSLPIIMLKQED